MTAAAGQLKFWQAVEYALYLEHVYQHSDWILGRQLDMGALAEMVVTSDGIVLRGAEIRCVRGAA